MTNSAYTSGDDIGPQAGLKKPWLNESNPLLNGTESGWLFLNFDEIVWAGSNRFIRWLNNGH